MLTISGVTKAFGGRTLFSDVTLQINRGDHVGLVGANGVGKSTLFSLLLGTEPADAGTITFQRGTTLGFLPQESAPAASETVLELATSHLAHLTPDTSQLASHAPDGPTIGRAKQILAGLGFRQRDFDRPARELSGGWVMRAHLARLLVHEPDLLLLDEPTNHLDLEALLWFQDYLLAYPGAIVVISHDREFLNRLATSMVELRMGRIFRYRGNYDDYLEQREANEANLLAAFKNQQREIDRLMRFVERFRAKNTKASQAQSKLKQIDRMEKIVVPVSEESEIRFDFPQPQRSGLRVLKLADAHFSYASTPVYAGLNIEVERGQRTVLVGPNGAGKSTLIKLLAGTLTPQAGTRELGHNVNVGYYSQYRLERLRPERTVLDEALDTPQRVTEQFVRNVLGCFLFREDDVFKPVSVLSGGEKSRLALVKLLLDPPNVLLMDEPTTHLDIASIDALIFALQQFEGTLMFISHDVYFIRAIATNVIHVNAGRLTLYPGDYQYYLDKTRANSARAALTASGGVQPKRTSDEPAPFPAVSRKEQKRLEAEERQARSRIRRERQQIVDDLERRILELETCRATLIRRIENPVTYAQEGLAGRLNRELAEAQRELERLNSEWEQAAVNLQALDPV
jgi:ATP-binding cassette subfamily F protein 3